jgi:hypothetical protein
MLSCHCRRSAIPFVFGNSKNIIIRLHLLQSARLGKSLPDSARLDLIRPHLIKAGKNRLHSATLGHIRPYSDTHLRWASWGNPSFSIRSASFLRSVNSSSVIEFITFLDAFVRSWNQPGVFVSAVPTPNIEAISVNTTS